MPEGQARNFEKLGRLLALLPDLHLFQVTEGEGLVDIHAGTVRRISTARDFAPVLIDHVNVEVVKNGKYHGDKVSETTLRTMLQSRCFLDNFPRAREVVTTPVVLSDDTPSRLGYNPTDQMLYVGPAVSSANTMDAINRFLDVMEWHSNADRTNAVAAFLTVPFRYRWPGAKPLILVTATKSHAGKGTVCDFITIDQTATARIEYEDVDWAMQNQLYHQLLQRPDIGIISLDNVRTDSSGRRSKIIRSAYVESFVTSAELVIGKATASRTMRVANRFLVLLNTNEGNLSIDLLNRCLPIRLTPTRDVIQRPSPIGNPKLEYLPTNRKQIESERWGMIARWVRAGKPLDESVAHHPMSLWAKVIGGILKVNGFEDFLANYAATRVVADPVRQAIGVLAFYNAGSFKRIAELVASAVSEGLIRTLLPRAETANPNEAQRRLGELLTTYVGETFTVQTPSDRGLERVHYRLLKKEGRYGTAYPHNRYCFEEIGCEHATGNPQGLVLERSSISDLPAAVADAQAQSPRLKEYPLEEA